MHAWSSILKIWNDNAVMEVVILWYTLDYILITSVTCVHFCCCLCRIYLHPCSQWYQCSANTTVDIRIGQYHIRRSILPSQQPCSYGWCGPPHHPSAMPPRNSSNCCWYVCVLGLHMCRYVVNKPCTIYIVCRPLAHLHWEYVQKCNEWHFSPSLQYGM